MKLLKSIAVSGLALFSIAAWAGMGVVVEDPWIREAPPTAKALAGYMVVKNLGSLDRALLGAESPAFGNVMLHRTVMENGVAKMVHQMKVTVPAGGAVVFKPRDYHLMLMKPKKALKAGDKVPVTITLDNGEKLDLTFEVRAAGGAMGGMNHGGMQMGH